MNARTPEGPVHRIARGPNPWEFRTTFSNRFDDYDGEYRVLYAATQITSCYVETLAWYRPDRPLQAELDAIDGENDFQPIGLIPASWFENRVIGTAVVEGRYADLYSAGWVGHLRSRLQPMCEANGLPDFDVNSLIQAQKRELTQMASRIVYDLGAYAGIYYKSRYGLDLDNWALFEGKAVILPLATRPVSRDDAALNEALGFLRLDVPGSPRPAEPEGN